MSFKLNWSTIAPLCLSLLLVSFVCLTETVAFQLPSTQTHTSSLTSSSHYHYLKTNHAPRISSITTHASTNKRTNLYNIHSIQSMSNDNNNNNDINELNNAEISRYSRHLVLGDVGMKGQKDLKNSSVLVIGAGGLGSPCLLYLAAAGVGHIGIVDADVVDESNLQRQIIHGTSTVNVSKCQSALQRIEDINPFVQVKTYEEEFTSSTAMRILGEGFSSGKKWDVVVDGSDNFPTKYLINDACEIVGVPWVYSAILAFEGQLSVFNYKDGPTYRDMMPVPPPPGDVPSCAEGGVLGVLPGTMGCLQATEVLKILLGKDQGVLRGRILVYDALEMKFTEAGLEKSEGREEITELIDYQGFCAGPKVAPPPKTQGRTMDESEDNSSDLNDIDFHNIEPKEALEKLKEGMLNSSKIVLICSHPVYSFIYGDDYQSFFFQGGHRGLLM
jgi:molybdopterin/thiamine biosynthesis adenylyltransferase